MIRPLRRAHRWIVTLLALLLPLVVYLALALRPDPPPTRAVPPELAPGSAPEGGAP